MNAFFEILKEIFCKQKPSKEELLRKHIRRKTEEYENTIHPTRIRTTYIPTQRNSNRR